MNYLDKNTDVHINPNVTSPGVTLTPTTQYSFRIAINRIYGIVIIFPF